MAGLIIGFPKNIDGNFSKPEYVHHGLRSCLRTEYVKVQGWSSSATTETGPVRARCGTSCWRRTGPTWTTMRRS